MWDSGQQHDSRVAPPLITLLVELHQRVGMLQSFVDLVNISFSCHKFLDKLSTPYVTNDMFHEAESRDSTAYGVDQWPCYKSRRMRPTECFADQARRLKKGRSSQSCVKPIRINTTRILCYWTAGSKRTSFTDLS